MMTRKPRPEEIFQLPKLGIPLDDEVLKGLKGISISQPYWECDGSCIHDLGDGRIGVELDLEIRNRSPHRPVRLDLRYAQLDLPWCQEFHWLKGPKKIEGRERYSLGGLPPRWFDPDYVLNHRLKGRELFLPGQELCGSLLGIGVGNSPFFRDRQTIKTHLSVYYEQGTRRCDLDVKFVIYLGPLRASLERRMEREARAAQTAKQSAQKPSESREQVVAACAGAGMDKESETVLVGASRCTETSLGLPLVSPEPVESRSSA